MSDRGARSDPTSGGRSSREGARHRFAASVRAAVDAAMTAQVPDSAFEEASTAIDAVVTELRSSGPTARNRIELHGAAGLEGPRSHMLGSPQIGAENPLSVPVTIDVVDRRVVGHVTFTAPYEGPPGFVHGGVIASVFDELLGVANVEGEAPGMTAKLTVRYRRPTPLHRPAVFEAWHERRQGRRFVAHATLHVDGELTCEAEGLFVGLDAELAEEYFGELRRTAANATSSEGTGS
ncbi:MAG: PaaI family thioesterase [Acidimicrobiia bacterium]